MRCTWIYKQHFIKEWSKKLTKFEVLDISKKLVIWIWLLLLIKYHNLKMKRFYDTLKIKKLSFTTIILLPHIIESIFTFGESSSRHL